MVKRFWVLTALVWGSFALCPSTANAGLVDYTVTSLGGNSWRYDYTINNTTPSPGFDELTVYFDVTRYTLLSSPVAPAGWDPILIQPDAGIPSDGFFDVLNLGGLLADGVSVAGFSVTFDFLGAGAPGSQSFDLLDSSDFSLVGSGTTTSPRVVGQVPEPSSALLAVLALGALVASKRRVVRRAKQATEEGEC